MIYSEKLLTRKQFQAMLPAGWKVVAFPQRMRHDDCTWYYREQCIVAIENDQHRLSASSGGDVQISAPEDSKIQGFYSSGQTIRHGRLTQRLIDEGEFQLNNWLDIEYEDLGAHVRASEGGRVPCFDEFGETWDDVMYSVSDACSYLAMAAKAINEGKHPFYASHDFPIKFDIEA